MKYMISGLAIAGAFGLALMPAAVQAASQYYVQSGAHCEAADGALVYGLQKTKTGLKNTSPGTRYITCSNTAIIAIDAGTAFKYSYAAARFDGPVGAKVTCAIHVGDADTSYGSVSNSITISDDSYSKVMRFGAGYSADIPARPSAISYPTLTCILPVGVEIQTDLVQTVDI